MAGPAPQPPPQQPPPAAGGPEEPTDSKSIMFRAPASNVSIIALTVGSFLATVVVLVFVVRLWPAATTPGGVASSPVTQTTTGAAVPQDTGRAPVAGPQSAAPRRYPGEADVLVMIILMGALGGLVHLTSSFGKFVGNRQLLRSWIIYYLLMPAEGAALAPMIYLLLRAGVLAPGANGPTTTNLNFVVLYGFAGLTGLFSKQAIEMLADVFATIFKRVKAKDALTADGGTKGTS